MCNTMLLSVMVFRFKPKVDAAYHYYFFYLFASENIENSWEKVRNGTMINADTSSTSATSH